MRPAAAAAAAVGLSTAGGSVRPRAGPARTARSAAALSVIIKYISFATVTTGRPSAAAAATAAALAVGGIRCCTTIAARTVLHGVIRPSSSTVSGASTPRAACRPGRLRCAQQEGDRRHLRQRRSVK